MQACYAGDAVFSDPVFTNLNATQVKAMWEMLIKAGKDLQVEYSNIKATDTSGSVAWVATYTFSATGRKVKNQISSSFVFDNGKIVQQTDRFSFPAWARQALGLPGLLLGWTKGLKKKVQQRAMGSLVAFMQKNKNA